MSKVSRITEGRLAIGSERSGAESTVIQTARILQGASGADGVDGAAGTILTPRGNWDAVVTYDAGDIIRHATEDGGNGSTYISLQGSNINNSPSGVATWWARVAEAGATGTAGTDGTGILPDAGSMPWRNAWITGRAYSLHDAVIYKGSAFICVDAHTSNNVNRPASGYGYWRTMIKAGKDGSTGAKGKPADNGSVGTNGTDGTNGSRGPAGYTGAAGSNGTNGTDGSNGSGASNLAGLFDTSGIGGATTGEMMTFNGNDWSPAG